MQQPKEYIAVCKEFQQLFNLSFPAYVYKLFIVLGRVTIDIIALDDTLHQMFGNYEEQGKSMKDIITEKDGEKAAKLIQEML